MQGWLITGIIGICSLIIGVYIWVATHISNRKRHPNAEELVYQRNCELRSKGIEDCIEIEIKNIHAKIEEHHSFNKSQFSEIKELIKNGYRNRKNQS
jgi:hypothetical protein